MLPPDIIPIATARFEDGKYVCITLCTLPRESFEYILADFEAQGTWDEESAFSALVAGLEWMATSGGGISEGEIDNILKDKPTIGPALWFMCHRNHGKFTFPPDWGLIVAADVVGDGIRFEPISDDFLAWVRHRAGIEQTGRQVH